MLSGASPDKLLTRPGSGSFFRFFLDSIFSRLGGTINVALDEWGDVAGRLSTLGLETGENNSRLA